MPPSSKNTWILIPVILAGLVLGGFIGTLFDNVPYCSWLNYGKTFGLDSPIILNLDIIVISFAFSVRFSISGIIGLILAIFIYKKI